MIFADYNTLLGQAPTTADTYLYEAIKSIDRNFGDGYAEKTPALVAAFMLVCAQDFATACHAKVAEEERG